MSENAGKNPNRGYLYPNEKKSERSPDLRGKGHYAGTDVLVSGWWQEEKGEQVVSMSFTDVASLPPKGSTAPPPPAPRPASRDENRGRLAPNAKKIRDVEPDFRGEGNLKGQKIEVAAWWRDREGVRMLSLSFSDPAQRAARTGATPSPSAGAPSPPPSSPAAAPPPPAAPSGVAPASPPNDGLDNLDLGDIFSQN